MPIIVRAPNHLGDLVMALPALTAAPHDVMVVRWLAPLLEMAGIPGKVLPLDRGGRGFLDGAMRLRARGYTSAVLLPPSLSSALVFRAGGIGSLRGTATDGRAWLLRDARPVAEFARLHRSEWYWRLVHAGPSRMPLVPQLRVPLSARDSWAALAGAAHTGAIGIFPGSNASSRRWPVDRFAALARRLANAGHRLVVFGGPNEIAMTAAVAGAAGGAAVDLGGRTDLSTLAAGLASCRLLISNDSGPLHLAAAVGARTVSLWGAGDPSITGPLGPNQHLLRRPDLACVPCVKNECPRTGRGYILENATLECLHLLDPDDVETVARTTLLEH